jgi:uncharacterized membrane protein
MREIAKPSGLGSLTAFLGLACLGCVLLYAIRVAVSGRLWYLFLVQNLGLAAVPYLVAASASVLSARIPPGRRRAWALAPLALLWLIFYPNAPYIFTDFIHVIERTYLKAGPPERIGIDAMLWYDLVMTAAFAFIGHFIGLVSMWVMQEVCASAWGKASSGALVLGAILMSGFGIYLGRFSRLNSWDLLLSPSRVLAEVAEAGAEPRALLFSAAFSLFILLSYAALAVFKRIRVPLSGDRGGEPG